MNIEKEALGFAHEIIWEYFINHNVDTLLTYMDGETLWLGADTHEISGDVQMIRNTLLKEWNELDVKFTAVKEQLDTRKLSADSCFVYGSIYAIPADCELEEKEFHLSLICRKALDIMKIVHCKLSAKKADLICVQNQYDKAAAKTNTLQKALETKEQQLQNLTEYIPGGVHQCANDDGLTLLSMSSGFIKMFGYSKEEIETIFHNRYAEMIYPGDLVKLKKEMTEQLEKGNSIELEYRVLCKNRKPMWILDKGVLMEDGTGERNFYCMLIEITDRKKEQEELRLSLERHTVIMDQTTDIIFEWDIKMDTLLFSSNWEKKFGYNPIRHSISVKIPFSENIHPDDMHAFVKIMKDTASGVPYSETEFRIKHQDGSLVWCLIRATTQYDRDKNPIKAVGVIIDISSQKEERQQLLDMAQKDVLTGLFNKAALQHQITLGMNSVNPKLMQSVFIIDIDNFKMVNDTYGHLCGDILLADIAKTIKNHFRTSDLIGRIGGDEFLVYLPEISGEDVAARKADNLIQKLNQITPGGHAVAISCSVGGVVVPGGTSDYLTLYQLADRALYYQKTHGKNGFTFYNQSMCSSPGEYLKSAVGTAIKSDELNAADDELAQYTFYMLYHSKDIPSAVNQLVEIVGQSYDVSRMYIFEKWDEQPYCHKTYEWCAPGIASEKNDKEDFCYNKAEDYAENFSEEDIFYCRDTNELQPSLYNVLKPQGVCSFLQCAMLDNGQFKGYVGFDECREKRFWTKQQIATLSLISNVLSVFLAKLRLENRLKAQESLEDSAL